MKTKNTSTLTTRVHVGHWANERTLSLSPDGTIAFQVTISCGSCETCARRHTYVTNGLRSFHYAYQWETRYNPTGYYVVFPKTRVRTLTGAVAYVNHALSLNLRLLFKAA